MWFPQDRECQPGAMGSYDTRFPPYDRFAECAVVRVFSERRDGGGVDALISKDNEYEGSVEPQTSEEVQGSGGRSGEGGDRDGTTV